MIAERKTDKLLPWNAGEKHSIRMTDSRTTSLSDARSAVYWHCPHTMSVCLSIYQRLQRSAAAGGFAVGRPAGMIYRLTAAWRCGSSKRGQCHVVSRGTTLNTSSLVHFSACSIDHAAYTVPEKRPRRQRTRCPINCRRNFLNDSVGNRPI